MFLESLVGMGGLVFEEVCSDLEAEGYEVQPIILPAASVGAPHRRDRVWFVAYSKRSSIQRELQQEQKQRESGRCNCRIDAPGRWEGFPSQPPICNGDDGLSDRLDSITFPKWRTESIKGGGNAIVPQLAFELFKAIEIIDQKTNTD